MKISNANMQLASSHTSVKQHETRESLKMWVGQSRPNFEGSNSRANRLTGDARVSLSDAAHSAQLAEAEASDGESAVDNDPKLNLIRSMLEFLTGRKIKLFDSRELQGSPEQAPAAVPAAQGQNTAPPPAAGYGVEYDYHESYSEIEQTRFAASGSVTTADGRTIAFDLELSMLRAYHEETNVSLRLGDAARKTDPLVLNFAGNAAQLTDQRFAFDLDADGTQENINSLARGSGYLVFDRNSDGIVNDGKELFGPTLGDGFEELSALDDDRNGWIDENDAAFDKLQVWNRDNGAGTQLQSLAEAGLGAISLSRVGTPFEIKNSANALLGAVRSTGVFLQEDGRAGTIQQIDLTA